ncbi:D-alanine--D-alanine ligase family protein [Bacillus horti]|uniref:D-alanine--D-alanine ligase n=1 Tax=Caldalkalibacillus horti TaxID=77523 RepID=A0ABT9VZ52_9BACI|nr:D-alanine--D-alanine ligase family protein [Bacillus horti]MDQ0165885.1 D-alanine-D-alanine ligase [Bacillus horti]
MKKTILVLYGGQSVEHQVSLQTAYSVLNALDKEKYHVVPVYITEDGKWCTLSPLKHSIANVEELQTNSLKTVAGSIADLLVEYFGKENKPLVFPVLHGPLGEDGTVQGFLELLDVPYVGNGVFASAVAIDKEKTKVLLKQEGILQAQSITIRSHEWKEHAEELVSLIESKLGYPCYIKPARMGSSVGIKLGYDRTELKQGILEAFQYDTKLLIEPEIIGREMQVAVLGNDYPKASVVGELKKERAFMDYNAKYIEGKIVPVIPAELPESVHEKMRDVAIRAFKALDCKGLCRVDFFVTKSYEVIVNEVNTLPGFTAFSLYPALWQKTDGTTYSQLLERLIQLALENKENTHQTTTIVR